MNRRTFLIGAALGLLTFALYLNNINAPFQLDDHSNIVNQPRSMMKSATPSEVWRVFIGSDYPRSVKNFTRSLTFVTFGFNHLLHGYDYRGWHLTNNLIHAMNATLVFLLLVSLLGQRSTSHSPYSQLSERTLLWTSALLSLAWAWNPMHTQTVTYIVQRLAALSTLFMLLTLLTWIHYLRTRSTRLLVVVALSSVAACLSKEMGFLLPMLLLVTTFYAGNQIPPQIVKRIRHILIGCMVVLPLLGLALYGNFGEHVGRMQVTADFSSWERLLTQTRVVSSYIALFLLPYPGWLTLDHHVLPSTGLLSPITTLSSTLFLLLLMRLAYTCRNVFPVLSLGLIWFFIGHLIESTVLPLELMFEHRMYFPSVGIVIATAAVIQAVRRQMVKTNCA